MGIGLSFSGTWILEITMAILSVATLGALIMTLKFANHSIVYSWHGVTLNTVVSALATVTKLAAMFVVGNAISQSKWNSFRNRPQLLLDLEAGDLASRGAAGGIGLLWRTRKM